MTGIGREVADKLSRTLAKSRCCQKVLTGPLGKHTIDGMKG